MAARNTTERSGTLQRGLVELFLKCTGNGTGNMTPTYGLGMSQVVTRTGAGLYTITLTDQYPALVNYSYGVQDLTTVDDWEVQIVSETVSSTKTVNIAVFKGGVASDLSSDEILMLRLVLSNTSIIPVRGA